MHYIAEILCVGTEILLGNIVNTNAKDLSEKLSVLGIDTYYHTVVGDNPERLKGAVAVAKSRANIIITTGGLGPTFDDLTKQTLAEAFGKKLVFLEDEAEKLRSYFKGNISSKMTQNNYRQAEFPEEPRYFQIQTAPLRAVLLRPTEVHVIMLPGPPWECNLMFDQCVVPYLKQFSDDEIVSHNIHIFGMGESAVEDKLNSQMTSMTNPTLAPYAKLAEVMLRVTAKAKTIEAAEEMMKPVIKMVYDTLGSVVYGVDVGTLENTVKQLLTEKGLTFASAESMYRRHGSFPYNRPARCFSMLQRRSSSIYKRCKIRVARRASRIDSRERRPSAVKLLKRWPSKSVSSSTLISE